MSDWLTLAQVKGALESGDGDGIRIAVLDSGIEIDHPYLQPRALVDDIAVDAQEPRFAMGGGDLYGHGTAVAGIIWDWAPRAEIGSFRVLGKDLRSRSALVALAATEAIARKYDILNCSFGCVISGHMALYKEWVDRAYLAGVHVVAASCSHKSTEWPAHFASVLGIDCCEDLSNATLYHRKNHIVEFAAPAREQRVAWNNGEYRTMMGSSFAAAYLCGLVARILSVHPMRDPFAVKAQLRHLCAAIPEFGSENEGVDSLVSSRPDVP